MNDNAATFLQDNVNFIKCLGNFAREGKNSLLLMGRRCFIAISKFFSGEAGYSKKFASSNESKGKLQERKEEAPILRLLDFDVANFPEKCIAAVPGNLPIDGSCDLKKILNECSGLCDA